MGERLGGRAKGTPNKSTQKLKAFLDGVFDELLADPGYRQDLMNDLRTRRGDKFALTILAYWAGRPAQAVDHTHSGTVSLAQIITGRIPHDEDEDQAEDQDGATRPGEKESDDGQVH